MATTIVRREFTSRDFDAVRQELLDVIESKFPNLFNDFFESHIGIVLLELISHSVDTLSFFLDYKFNELFIDTVTERVNMVSLGKLIGFQLRGRTAAKVTLNCSTEPFVGNIDIAKGTQVSTAEGIIFEVEKDFSIVDSDTVLVSGKATFDITAVQGETIIDTFESDGTTNQVFVSSSKSVVENVATEVRVSAVTWTSVINLFGEGAEDVYELTFLAELDIRILFGDGIHGNVPGAFGTPIEIEYLSGGGKIGNVGIGTLDGTITGIVGVTPQDVSFINNAAASGGADEESVDEARRNAPLSFQTLNRIVTEVDFKAFVESQAAVLRAAIASDPVLRIVTVSVMATGYGKGGLGKLAPSTLSTVLS